MRLGAKTSGGVVGSLSVPVVVDVDVVMVVALVMMRGLAPGRGSSNRSCLFGHA